MDNILDVILVNRCNQRNEFRTVLPAKMCVHVLLILMLAAAAVLVVGAGVGAAATWYVDDDGGAGIDFTEIQDAVDAASDGDTIHVAAGEYTENVNVNKRLTLIGEDVDVVTVAAASASDHVFEVTADYVNVSGFMMTGATDSWKAGIYLGFYVDHCNISDNNASNNSLGIWLQRSSDNTLTDNTANSNVDDDGNGVGIYVYDYSSDNTLTGNNASNNDFGILLQRSSDNTLTDNTATSNNDSGFCLYSSNDNTLTSNTALNNNGYDGIAIVFSNSNALANNIVNSNNHTGIHLHSSSDNTLANNIMNSNTWDGIYLERCPSNNTFTNNTANSNGWRGIYLYASSGNTIANNTANLNGDSGIYLFSSSNNNILTGNTANSNNCYGVFLYYSSNNTIYNNCFNNTNNACADGVNTWNITPTAGTNIIGGSLLGGNYWSDYAEKYPNAEELDESGIWDTPYMIQGGAGAKDNHPLMEQSIYKRAWTFMIYMGADNNMDDEAEFEIREMENAVGKSKSTDKVNIVYLLDKKDSDTTIFSIYKEGEEGKSKIEHSYGSNSNSADSNTLKEFINWVCDNYPEQRYCLVLWDHGYQWKGVILDTTPNNKIMALEELDDALKNSNIAEFEVIGFDACLMGGIEVDYQIKDECRYIIHSEEREITIDNKGGWPYDTILESLITNPQMDGKELSETIVKKYKVSYENSGYKNYATISAVDTSRMDTLIVELNTLSEKLKHKVLDGGKKEDITSARESTDSYSSLYQSDKDRYNNFIDLYDFTEKIKNGFPEDDDLKASTDGVMNAIHGVDGAVIKYWSITDKSGNHKRSHGISIYFPNKKCDTEYDDIKLSKDKDWNDFLWAYFSKHYLQVNAKGPIDLILVDPDGLTINKESNEILNATYTELDIDGDGELDDRIFVPHQKIGEYQITVIPEPDAEPTGTYTLEVSVGGTTTVLAENVPVSEIPSEPYIIKYHIKGDLNRDDQITPADAAIALRLAANGAQNPAADVSGDGSVTSLDALMILQAAADAIDL